MRASDGDWDAEENALARNFAFVPFLLGLALTRLYSLYNSMTQSSSSLHLSWESTAAQLYMTAALIELAAEPLAVYAQRQLLFKIRASVEGFSITSQCILTLLYFPGPMENGARDVGQAVLAYAWAQMGAALILVAGYALSLSLHIYRQNSMGIWDFWKSMVPGRTLLTGQLLDPYYVSVALSFWAQSFLKHLLTVGDRFLLVALAIPHEQKGIYRLVSDLGSLIARILFQPLEETGRAYFSRSLTGREGTLIISLFKKLLTSI